MVERVLQRKQAGLGGTLSTWLVEQGPACILGTAMPASGLEAAELAPYMSRLQRSAQEIVARRTVFLLPEDVAGLERLARHTGLLLPDLVKTLAEQLYQLLEHGQADHFTLVRVGRAGSGKGLLDQIVEHLHSRLTTGILDQAILSREGPVLFVGPTGTGKSYGARLLASMMGREYFPVNLSAVVETTLESRIHGYAAGAFTGASRNGNPGWFELANNRILFLDEFQSVPIAYQTQLLDLLNAVSDTVAIARIGEDARRLPWNVKVILAVNEDINELLRSGRLRTDLFYRMRHLVHFPSLQERFADPATNRHTLAVLLRTYRWRLAPMIAQPAAAAGDSTGPATDELTKARLRSMFPEFDDAATKRLLEYRWPGNLRELERVASDLFCDCDSMEDPVISGDQVGDAIGKFAAPGGPAAAPKDAVASTRRALLADVEDALRSNGFVIEHTLSSLKKSHPMYNLRSRKSLKLFLVQQREKMSEDVRSHPRLLRFMVGTGRRSPPTAGWSSVA